MPANPFVTIDRPGVGRLMRIAVEEGRAANPSCISGSAASTAANPWFATSWGSDYVSCSPFRVETARLAAGQAAVASVEGAST